ncbi:hypothetical protein M404DRAFT_23317 [Pisolithus tinctorius Marx 270]|uniref:Uncharacterized protein n=1 Tax=Pisolithus tinctorius Marx 270 TaxID=870435 RepID=A0A0C3PIW0_PISTI|nr:hypothetical protein M404DRAFT_23317 [Pisolithus tinctorius Marx 270]
MSESRLITMTDKNDEGWVVINWTQVLDDTIQYDTDDEEEVMKAKLKERKRQKAAEQAQQEEQRAEKEKAEAEKAAWEAKERRVCEEEERQEAKCKCKAKASKSDEAGTGGTSGEAGGEVKRVVMDPGQVPVGDRKDTEAVPKAGRTDKGKKQKAEEENSKEGPSNQKWARTSVRPTKVLDLDELEASRSGMKEAGMARYSGLENKLERLIKATGLIANNLASLFELHKTMVENSGCIADVLKSILDELYGFGMAVSPLDLGSSKLDSDELHKEAEWLKDHSKDEEESEGEDESMAKAE